MNPSGPLVVVTNWGAQGVPFLGALLLALAAGAFLYWRALRRTQSLSPIVIFIAATAALAAAWLVPVLFSSDVYAYAAYGEMTRLGLNPYAHAPLDTSDALVRAAQFQWGSAFPICLYGPAFVGLAWLLVTAFAPLGALAQLDAFRAAACAAFLLCIPLATGAFAGDRAARLRAAATIGLNPVAIWCAAEGHNDAIALAAVLVGFVVVRRRNVGFGAAILALSSLVKLPGIAAAAALAGVQRRARVGAIAGSAIAAASSIPLLAGIATQLAPHGSYAPQASFQAMLAPLGAIVALTSAGVVAAVLGARGIALVRRGQNEGWIWMGLAAWVLIPNPYPWYALWLVALAALAPSSRAGAVAIVLSFVSPLRYIPDAIATPTPLPAAILGALASFPLLALVRPWRRHLL